MSFRVAWVSCVDLPEVDVDEGIGVAALRGAGLEVEVAAWDDPGVDWGGFDLAVLRSPWNYPDLYVEFLDWLGRVEGVVPVLNPAGVVRENLDKRYLGRLAEWGVAVVPTVYASSGEELRAGVLDRGWETIVVKPVVGAGSMGTRVFDVASMGEAEAHLEGLGMTGMVQPFLRSVNDGGERALVWVDGAFTHKVVKRPRFADGEESVSEALELTSAEREFGESVMGLVSGELLYGRVDVMAGDAGEILLSELELAEPSLFFLQFPEALDRFVAGVCGRLGAC